ncbi:hypothetical protein ROZALSC1DRAFT_25298, partial [Rozella allomycis CSF55]
MITEEEFGRWIETQGFKEKISKFVQDNQFKFEDFYSFTKEEWVAELETVGRVIYNKLHPAMAATIDTSGLDSYWNALRVLEIGAPNTVVNLPDNVHILGNVVIGKSWFVRPCYTLLLAKCLEIIADPTTPHLVILGNPGI